ncbi:coatomer subunit delta-1-like [Chenopodium quinoa]|uniref:coatomer subunit delta-1-like n=1 Tax=Chenopodium quinoa TaxID=63459 RepID=UPI000B76C468|nr:coatomer subunit delta-1-like [Chenopodium quinoa]
MLLDRAKLLVDLHVILCAVVLRSLYFLLAHPVMFIATNSAFLMSSIDGMKAVKTRFFQSLLLPDLPLFKTVVLAASITSKSGKALLSRQSVNISRIRVEGLLAAFPKLIGTGKQHSYVETDDVRYVYQPIETIYLILLTSKQSNILEDLETLRMLSKLVPEYAFPLNEEGICKMAFELIFAFDEVISLGHRENVTVTQVKQFCKMESEEEKLHKIVLQNKIKETKENMKHKAIDIDKSKAESSRGGKGGFMSLQSMGSVLIERPLDDLSISSSNSGSGNASGLSAFGSSTDLESYSNQPKAHSATFKGQGMQLGKNQRTNQFLQSLKAEGEEIIEDLQPSLIKSRAVIPPPSDPVTLVVEEKLFVTLKRDGGLANFDVQGTLSLQILEEKDDYLHVQVESGNKPSILFKTHPNINKELFSNESILGLKDPNRPFPTGQSVDGVGLLKWKMQSLDESAIPLTISCWPSVSGNVTDVSIEYEASSNFDLQNVIISVPLPSLKQAPNVRQIDGGWRNDSKNSVFEWSILLIDNSNRSGSVEFAVPAADSSAFFPISVQFSAVNTFSGLKVVNIMPLKGGSPPKFVQRTMLCAENYTVV